ncbi:hypothetical protein [Limimaricola hongkongensis]|uniref:Uncharacterized protein n=1 Tax=Limimaricola hongkongensis DSM 17492 TaxID=1122180 RepID=A0A017HC99_9RHOB|nr:hypothetical protein [Limimaricola hongkongensis]EYD71783.1 hypothetical protein Lokhon_01853 [Limimaricola hongkongensis DSM 17492]
MPDSRSYLHTLMRGAVRKHFPKQACAALEIAEYWGGAGASADYAAFSRKMNGTREWSLSDAVAIYHLTGSRRILDAIQSEGSDDLPTDPAALLAHATSLIKEGGEGAAALIDAGQGGCLDEAEAQLVDIAEAAARALAAVRAMRGAA